MKTLNVLCVEDNPGDMSLLCGMLKESALNVDQVVCAATLSQAREKFLLMTFDVIFLDLSLPDTEGLETVHRMKEIAPDVPIIVMTGSRDEAMGMSCLHSGAEDYLVKGHCDSALIQRVLRYVIERRLTADLTRITAQLKSELVEREKAQAKIINEKSKTYARQLEHVNKELETFSYSVSHDLQAPLRAINGFAEKLLGDLGERINEASREDVKRICAASQRMGQLIDDLLILSKVSSGKIGRETVDLSAQIEQIANDFKEAHPERRIEFAISPVVKAEGDPKLILIALENLLNNACKFTQKKSLAKIDFGVTEREGERVFFLKDNGAGFDMEYVSRLFGTFQRLHDSGEYPGSGIGLATVQRIIHRHGGRVWAEGKVNEGASFYFTLNSGDPV